MNVASTSPTSGGCPPVGPGLPSCFCLYLVLTPLRGLPLMLSKLACSSVSPILSPLPLSQCLWLPSCCHPIQDCASPMVPLSVQKVSGLSPGHLSRGPVPSTSVSNIVCLFSVPWLRLSPRCPGHKAPSSSLRLHPRLCLSLACPLRSHFGLPVSLPPMTRAGPCTGPGAQFALPTLTQ